MNRINQLFDRKKKNVLSVYFTAGFPELHDTERVVRSLELNGVDMVEIGIPFSDPMADGPVIQNSSSVALRNGMSLKLLFSQLENIRDAIKIPLILMGYLNPVMQYGFEKFCSDCKRVGVDGLIIPDLPFNDYLSDYKPIADRFDLRIIMLITPETSDERIRLIDENTDGFIYMVSSASTTGAQNEFDHSKQDYFRRINSMSLRNPRMIGFGISNKATLNVALENASGAIVGSRFVGLLKENKDIEMAVKELFSALNN